MVSDDSNLSDNSILTLHDLEHGDLMYFLSTQDFTSTVFKNFYSEMASSQNNLEVKSYSQNGKDG